MGGDEQSPGGSSRAPSTDPLSQRRRAERTTARTDRGVSPVALRPLAAGTAVSRDRASPAERAYLELVARYQSAILNYVYRLVGDSELAEDLTQETYVKAYGAIERLDLGASAEARRRAWLYRIAHNVATDHLRRKARLQWLSLDRLRGQGSGDPADEVVEREPVNQAMSKLTAEQREVLQLFCSEGLSALEVAEVLGISAAAARKRRQRAREAFEGAYRSMDSD